MIRMHDRLFIVVPSCGTTPVNVGVCVVVVWCRDDDHPTMQCNIGWQGWCKKPRSCQFDQVLCCQHTHTPTELTFMGPSLTFNEKLRKKTHFPLKTSVVLPSPAL
jgi:hypothetical protein